MCFGGNILPAFDYPWYALQVKARHEKKVAAALRGRGFVEFLPLYRSYHRSGGRMQPVQLPLFPGYVFCQFDYRNRLPVLVNPGVFSIVGNGHCATPVEKKEIEAIAALVESGLNLSPWPFIQTGDMVYIERGPLAGLEGILLGFKSEYRVIVSVGLLQRSVAVEVNRRWVRPVNVTSIIPHGEPGPSFSMSSTSGAA
jgi:transcription antitermination factor NusG